jgi:hypothetical protein
MFDSVICEVPLPRLGVTDRVFQTKDTPAQFLDTYVIRADGRFVHRDPIMEEVPEGEREHEWHILRRVGGDRDEDWTGEVCFYTFFDQKRSAGWVEFKAVIVRGKLDGDIELVEFRESDAAPEIVA